MLGGLSFCKSFLNDVMVAFVDVEVVCALTWPSVCSAGRIRLHDGTVEAGRAARCDRCHHLAVAFLKSPYLSLCKNS